MQRSGTGSVVWLRSEPRGEIAKRDRNGRRNGGLEATRPIGSERSEAASERCKLDVMVTVILRIRLLRADPQSGTTLISICIRPTSTRNHTRWPPAHPPNPYLSTRSPVRLLTTRPLTFHPSARYPASHANLATPVRRSFASDIPKQLGVRQRFQALYAVFFG